MGSAGGHWLAGEDKQQANPSPPSCSAPLASDKASSRRRKEETNKHCTDSRDSANPPRAISGAYYFFPFCLFKFCKFSLEQLPLRCSRKRFPLLLHEDLVHSPGAQTHLHWSQKDTQKGHLHYTLHPLEDKDPSVYVVYSYTSIRIVYGLTV